MRHIHIIIASMAHLVKSRPPALLAHARALAYNARAATACWSIILPELTVVAPATTGPRLQSSLDETELAIDASYSDELHGTSLPGLRKRSSHHRADRRRQDAIITARLTQKSQCLHSRAKTPPNAVHKRRNRRLILMAVRRPSGEPSQCVRPVVSATANRVSSAVSAEPPSSGIAPDAASKWPWMLTSATSVRTPRLRVPCRRAAASGAGFRAARWTSPASNVVLVCWSTALNAVLSPPRHSTTVPHVASITPAS
jgi:hypothetical protein